MKTIITRFLMCCILFAVSFVTSFAADKLILIGDAAPDGWALNNSVAMLNQGNDVRLQVFDRYRLWFIPVSCW